MLLGAHMSVAGGLEKAFERGKSVGCETIQIFSKNSNQWKAKPISDSEARVFKAAMAYTKISPVLVHDSYLINLGHPDRTASEKAVRAFVDELRRCEQIGAAYLVAHPGAHVGSGEEAGLEQIARGLSAAHRKTQGFKTRVLLETTAGQGTTLGHRFEHLARLFDLVEQPERVGVCIDTCHLLAAGYDIRTAKGYAAVFEEFDKIVGLERIEAFHLNDAKKPIGSRVDRHEHIGKGFIGLEGFRALMRDKRFEKTTMVLETPKGKDMKEDVENLSVLRSLEQKKTQRRTTRS